MVRRALKATGAMDLCFEQSVPLTLDTVFRFHENPANLALLLVDVPGFRMLHHDGTIQPGAMTWFEVTVARCVPVVLGFRHTIYEPPSRFGEELVHGPFCPFIHVHEFEQAGEMTIVRDVLNIRLMSEYGGELVTRLCVGPSIRSAFLGRTQAYRRLAESGYLARATVSRE